MICKIVAWRSSTQIAACGWQVMSIWVGILRLDTHVKNRTELNEFEEISAKCGIINNEQFNHYMKIYND